jgi:hypothetical protein
MLLRHASLALAAALAFGVPAASAAPDTPVAAEHVSAPTTPAAADAQDSTSYAQREQQDHKVADYQGGNVVVIGASGGAIIVLLLLVLLLV